MVPARSQRYLTILPSDSFYFSRAQTIQVDYVNKDLYFFQYYGETYGARNKRNITYTHTHINNTLYAVARTIVRMRRRTQQTQGNQ